MASTSHANRGMAQMKTLPIWFSENALLIWRAEGASASRAAVSPCADAVKRTCSQSQCMYYLRAGTNGKMQAGCRMVASASA